MVLLPIDRLWCFCDHCADTICEGKHARAASVLHTAIRDIERTEENSLGRADKALQGGRTKISTLTMDS